MTVWYKYSTEIMYNIRTQTNAVEMTSAVYLILLICITAAQAKLTIDNKVIDVIKECKKDKKCASFCIGNKLQFITETGDYDLTKVPSELTKKYEFVKKCIDDNKDTEKCDKANNINKCFIAEGTTLIKSNVEACLKESDLGNINFDVKSLMSKLKDKKFLCFVKCMLMKSQIMDEKNNIDLEVFEKVMKQQGYDVSEATNILKTCAKNSNQNDKCEQISKIGICVGMTVAMTVDMKKIKEIGNMLKP